MSGWYNKAISVFWIVFMTMSISYLLRMVIDQMLDLRQRKKLAVCSANKLSNPKEGKGRTCSRSMELFLISDIFLITPDVKFA